MAEIGDYAFLSDTRSAALVDRDGSVDWYCLPRFDSPSVFGRLLGAEAGHWCVRPRGPYRAERGYVGHSLVLRTVFRGPEGAVELTDALALDPRTGGHDLGRNPPRLLIRRVRGLQGTVPMEVEFAPRFEYGLTLPRLVGTDGGIMAHGGPVTLHLRSPVPLELGEGLARAAFDVSAADTLTFSLAYIPTYGTRDPVWQEPDTAAEGTVKVWEAWMDLHRGYQGRHVEQVRRSALVLQGLTYQPSGAVLAAATTSLPEVIGHDANWDYRFAWLRDLSLTLRAQWVAACPEEAGRFFTFVAAALGRLQDRPVQIMLGIEGERDLTERTLPHLEGFAGSRPVRVGNDAWNQKQLDVLGEVLDAAYLLRDQIGDLTDNVLDMLVAFADRAAASWEEPDAGMWEARDRERHYLSSKVLCWVALDRAVKLAPRLGAAAKVERWSRVRGEIRHTILDRGWSDRIGAYTGAFGSDDLDASVLLMPIVGFLPATDERMLATIDRIEHELGETGLVRRWASEPSGFLITTYWLAESLARAGDITRASQWFDSAGGYANDLGLLAEEADPNTGQLLGNYPQAFSHTGLINAAWQLTCAASGRPETTGDQQLDGGG